MFASNMRTAIVSLKHSIAAKLILCPRVGQGNEWIWGSSKHSSLTQMYELSCVEQPCCEHATTITVWLCVQHTLCHKIRFHLTYSPAVGLC